MRDQILALQILEQVRPSRSTTTLFQNNKQHTQFSLNMNTSEPHYETLILETLPSHTQKIPDTQKQCVSKAGIHPNGGKLKIREG